MYKIYKMYIVKNVHCFDNTLIVSCLSSCRLLNSHLKPFVRFEVLRMVFLKILSLVYYCVSD